MAFRIFVLICSMWNNIITMEKMIDFQQIHADVTADVYYRIYDDYIPDNIDKQKLALVHELIYYSWLIYLFKVWPFP